MMLRSQFFACSAICWMIGLASVPSPALALFDAQLLFGRRWHADKDSNGVAWEALTVAGHMSPLPPLPLAVGLSYTTLNNQSDTYSELTGSELAIDVTAWIPLVPFVTPYGRLNYPFATQYKGKYANNLGDFDYELKNGVLLFLGVKTSILPLVSLLVEVGKGIQMRELNSCVSGGNDCAGGTNRELKSTDTEILMLGLEIGF